MTNCNLALKPNQAILMAQTRSCHLGRKFFYLLPMASCPCWALCNCWQHICYGAGFTPPHSLFIGVIHLWKHWLLDAVRGILPAMVCSIVHSNLWFPGWHQMMGVFFMITCICTGECKNVQVGGKAAVSRSVERRRTTPWKKKIRGEKKVNISPLPKAQLRKAIII